MKEVQNLGSSELCQFELEASLWGCAPRRALNERLSLRILVGERSVWKFQGRGERFPRTTQREAGFVVVTLVEVNRFRNPRPCENSSSMGEPAEVMTSWLRSQHRTRKS
jgi:hypothetical protein